MKFKNQLIITSTDNILDINIPYKVEFIYKVDLKDIGDKGYSEGPDDLDFIEYGSIYKCTRAILEINLKNSPKHKFNKINQAIRILGYNKTDENKIISLFSSKSVTVTKINSASKRKLLHSISSELYYLNISARYLNVALNQLNGFSNTNLKNNLTKEGIGKLQVVSKDTEEAIKHLKSIAVECFKYFSDNFLLIYKGVGHEV
jgi:hypothetical protein